MSAVAQPAAARVGEGRRRVDVFVHADSGLSGSGWTRSVRVARVAGQRDARPRLAGWTRQAGGRRPRSPGDAVERADVAAMHASNRAAWDEAAERYEGWLPEAIELIRSGGTNLFPSSSSSSATCTAAAGGPSTSSAPAGGTRCRSGTSAPRRSSASTSVRACSSWRTAVGGGRSARALGRADVLHVPHELDGSADLLYTGRGSLIWLQDLDAWAAVLARLLAPGGRFVLFEGHPAEWLFDVDEDGRWIATDYDYFAGPEASKGWAPGYIDHLSIDDDDQSWKFARAWTLGEVITALLGAGCAWRRGRAPGRLVGGHADVRDEERGRIPLSFSVPYPAGCRRLDAAR